MQGRFGGTRTRRSKMPYSGAIRLGVGALALVGTVSLLLLLRRRAKRNGSSTEEVNKDPKPHEDKGHSEQAEVSTEGQRE